MKILKVPCKNCWGQGYYFEVDGQKYKWVARNIKGEDDGEEKNNQENSKEDSKR